jgi:AcrR family transcriptional regulator
VSVRRRARTRGRANEKSPAVPRRRSEAPRPRRAHAQALPRVDESRRAGKETDRRKEIIARAAPILMSEGLAISMNELARRLHMTKPGLYYHFRDKQELLYAIMQRTMDWTHRMALEVTVSTSDNGERLRRIVREHAMGVAAYDAHRMAGRERTGARTMLVVDEVNALRPEDRRVITQSKRAYFELVRATVEQLQKERRLRRGLDVTVATFTVLGMAMWLTKWYEPSGRLSAEEVTGQIADMAVAAVLTDE